MYPSVRTGHQRLDALASDTIDDVRLSADLSSHPAACMSP